MVRTVIFCLLLAFSALGTGAQENTAQVVEILAKQNLALHSKPDFYSNVLSVFESGGTLAAFGRNSDGAWLQTEDGWVNARNAAANGDKMSLPMTANSVSLTATANRNLRQGPDTSYEETGSMLFGKTTFAIGRNHDGSWLQTPHGWLPADNVHADGDIVSLPVTFASVTVTATKNSAYLSAPTWDADVTDIFERDAEAFGFERTDDSNW